MTRALRRRPLLTGLVVCLVLGSCDPADQTAADQAPAVQPATGSFGGADRTAAAQTVLDRLALALLHGDRTAFSELMSERDPSFGPAADRLYGVAHLPTTSLTFRLEAPLSVLTTPRRAVLGPAAWVQQVTVAWALRGDSYPAQHTLWLTFLRDGKAIQVAGTADGPAERRAQPLWLVDSVQAERQGKVTVLAASDRSASTWARRGSVAAAAVARRLHGAHRPGAGRASWNGSLVVEVPADQDDFERVLGVAAGSYGQIAAVAWPEGPTEATAALRIVVNPALADRLEDDRADVLLTHEATHIATRSAASRAPTWLVEGFADYVAYDAFPASAEAAAAPAMVRVQKLGPPRELPADDRFSAGAADLELAYAQSWLACRYLAGTSSPLQLDRFYQQVDSGVSVAQALRSVYGWRMADFMSGWRRYLQQASDRG